MKASLSKMLLSLAVVAVMAPCQASESHIVVLPTRQGIPPEGPELGPTLESADAATCSELRRRLANLVAVMADSLSEVRGLWLSHQGDVGLLWAFDSRWRPRFVAIKGELFTMATCEDFKPEWASALEAWRDVFLYEKQSLADLSADRTSARTLAGPQLEAWLRKLLFDLRP